MAVVTDKECEGHKLCDHWRLQGIGTCVLPKRILVEHPCNAALNRPRHMAENLLSLQSCIAKGAGLNNRRRLSLRLDRAETSFRVSTAAPMNLRLKIKHCSETLAYRIERWYTEYKES